ncbi:MAG: viroplasmin family protein [Candidatus Taylorbacteria bacterium]
MESRQITIFTDGSSRGNPGPGGWGVLIGVRCKVLGVSEEEGKVIELGGREDHTTNNRMELMAAIQALSHLKTLHLSPYTLHLSLYTDSRYIINGITKWVFGWRMNGWKTKEKKDVLNRDLWAQLADLTEGANIEWKYVGGHVGVAGNERTDEIATLFADGEKVNLFSGPMEKYPLKNVLDISGDESKSKSAGEAKNRSKKPAYSYVSMIDRKIEKHQTWKDCEARVKGVSGAKYKKSLSLDDEKRIMEEWQNM